MGSKFTPKLQQAISNLENSSKNSKIDYGQARYLKFNLRIFDSTKSRKINTTYVL